VRVKGDSALAELILTELRKVSGILDSKINIGTGSIVVTHDATRVSSHAIVNFLIGRQWVDNVIPFPSKVNTGQPGNSLPLASIPSRKISSQTINKVAGCVLKLMIPILAERYLGKSAAKMVAALI
jgi:hypothetical protein